MKDIEIRNNKGQLHDECNPSVVVYYENGAVSYEAYYINGKRHNENGPAVISYCLNGSIDYKAYYKQGKNHNESGPGYIEYYENGDIGYKEYWLNNKDVTEILTEWQEEHGVSFNDLSEEQKVLRKLQIGI